MQPIIEIKNVSKKYQIRDKQSYYSLRDTITDLFKNPLNIIKNVSQEEYWALKNITFNIEPGEVVGIIGKNGAGKSTLLKILSRITPPTHGEIILRGRVASLLEVGTGFHPELSGRENIFLNGTLLGMTKNEIKRKFDEIVEFAEISKFIDTPVKRYSSGMYTRLAFAVAAHLEPDILIVDEVLSVGDAAFQKKSLGKMRDVSQEGRTVLFVSHNLSAINTLCDRTILLHEGKVIKDGRTSDVINTYLKTSYLLTPRKSNLQKNNSVKTLVDVKSIKVLSKNKLTDSVEITEPIIIEITYETKKPKIATTANIQLIDSSGILIFNSPEKTDDKWKIQEKSKGIFVARCKIPGNLLAEGLFSVRVTLSIRYEDKLMEIDYPDALNFNVQDNLTGKSVRGTNTGAFPGVVRPMLNWHTTKQE